MMFYSVVWYQNFVSVLVLFLHLDFGSYCFGIPKVLLLDLSFTFGIHIVHLTFNLQWVFEKD